MDLYLDLSHDHRRNNPVGGRPEPYWDTLRDAMGRTRAYAERTNLLATVPHNELASIGFCLADPGTEYLVYLSQGGEVTVDLSTASGTLNTECMHLSEGNAILVEPTAGGSLGTLKVPFSDNAVLYAKDPKVRISYPDFIWDNGLYITETQKTTARVHAVPGALLRSLWAEGNASAKSNKGMYKDEK